MKPVEYGLAVPGPLPTPLECGTAYLEALRAHFRKRQEEKAVRIWRAAFNNG